MIKHKWTDKAAGKISKLILKVQTKTSDAVNRKLKDISKKRLKIILFLFCLLWGSLSLYFILFDKKASSKIDKIKTIQQPDDYRENKVDEDIYKQIQEYKHYMDSLKLPIRQSLLDSMTILEQIYLQQNQSNENK